jgi:hypothetical protein
MASADRGLANARKRFGVSRPLGERRKDRSARLSRSAGASPLSSGGCSFSREASSPSRSSPAEDRAVRRTTHRSGLQPLWPRRSPEPSHPSPSRRARARVRPTP